MRYLRLRLFFLLLVLVACSTTPEVPSVQSPGPDGTPVAAITVTGASGATAIGIDPATPTASSISTTAATSVAPTNTPAATVPPTFTAAAAPPVSIGEVKPITFTLPSNLQVVADNTFATFKPNPVNVTPTLNVPSIAADLSNVAVPFILSEGQRQLLAQQGFAISPGNTKEFFELYERARYNYEPVFVTSDSLLHVYHLLFDRTLRVAEQEKFAPMLATMDWVLLNTALEQLEALKGTSWQDAARRNAAYFAVAVKLLNPDWPIPQGLDDLVEPELASIDAHAGLEPSAIFPNYPYGEDWSQYVPRGHYTRSEQLQRYFRAMMWHGRMTMRVKETTETQQAALMTLAWQSTTIDGNPVPAVWRAIYDPTVFFVGRSDDLTPGEYSGALQSAYGNITDPAALVNDASFARFQALAADLRAPEILGMVISDDMPEEENTKGLRFMGQRFVPDSFVFRQLIHRNVPERFLPKGLDLFAVMGSGRALEHLAAAGETNRPKYNEQFAKIKEVVAAYDEQTWTQNLYWSWLYALRPMLDTPPAGYPQFMRSPAWLDKQLNTALGSWSELRHDTILYAKQVYAEMGAGALPPPVPEPPKGYVEPVPEVYARISALSSMTIEGLKRRGLLAEPDEQALTRMVEIANRLQVISEKQLRGEALTEEEYERIRFYGADIESLTFAAGQEAGEPTGPGGSGASDDLEAAVIADVATNPDGGTVLEEGVGRVFPIYAVVPIEGKLTVAVGGVFSHYEFEHPMDDRLTDEAWSEMLDAGNAPPFEPWKQALMVEETPAKDLADTIRSFNDKLTEALWLTDVAYVEQYLVDPELSDTRNYIAQLKGQGQFVGLKRLALEYLSFDLQDATHATVTTRERFSEELRSGSPLEAGTEPPVVGVRPPYETTVAYTMVKGDAGWQIAQIVVNNPPQPFQQP